MKSEDQTELTKIINTIVKIDIIDKNQQKIGASYQLHKGVNEFSCLATFMNGNSALFETFWTCPMALTNGGYVDYFGLLGKNRLATVSIDITDKISKYAELACWTMFPDDPETDANIYPHKRIQLDYSGI